MRFTSLYRISAFAMALALTAIASAHFIFIIPQPGFAASRIIMSETLSPEDAVRAEIFKDASFQLRTLDGKDAALEFKPLDSVQMAMETPGEGTRVIRGLVDLGLMERGGTTHVLVYHPKTIIGDAFDGRTVLGDAVPVEIVPVKHDGKVRLKLLIEQKPKASTEIRVIFPDNSEKKLMTDDQGLTLALEENGRFGAWARFWEDKPGERSGKEYSQVRHYATLVFDTETIGASGSAEKQAGNEQATLIASVEKLVDLPFATSSFGAAVSDGWLYVYGGHIAPTHEYNTESASGEFRRLDLSGGRVWETLPEGPRLQGMNLAAFEGAIYRAGGMQSLNAPGDADDNRSIAQVGRFDPAARRWTDLAPLPEPRSSHDVAVVGGRLYVLGGWNMQGKGVKSAWPEQMYSLDLTKLNAEWNATPQPWRRRALISAVIDGQIYAIGGFDQNSKPSLDVDIFDTRTGAWSKGPALPSPAGNGFAPAATVLDRRLYVSVGSGGLYRLGADGATWEQVTRTTPRIVHRAVPFGSRVLLIGGAAKGDNLGLIESVTVAPAPSDGALTSETTDK